MTRNMTLAFQPAGEMLSRPLQTPKHNLNPHRESRLQYRVVVGVARALICVNLNRSERLELGQSHHIVAIHLGFHQHVDLG
jgi:hypothetical protein